MAARGRKERGARVSERRRGAGYKEGKRRRGAPAGGGGAAPFLSAFGVRRTVLRWGRRGERAGGPCGLRCARGW